MTAERTDSDDRAGTPYVTQQLLPAVSQQVLVDEIRAVAKHLDIIDVQLPVQGQWIEAIQGLHATVRELRGELAQIRTRLDNLVAIEKQLSYQGARMNGIEKRLATLVETKLDRVTAEDLVRLVAIEKKLDDFSLQLADITTLVEMRLKGDPPQPPLRKGGPPPSPPYEGGDEGGVPSARKEVNPSANPP